jgi:hypothetical protein
MFSRSTSGTIILWRYFKRFRQTTVLSPRHNLSTKLTILHAIGQFDLRTRFNMSATPLGAVIRVPT